MTDEREEPENVVDFQRRLINEWPREMYLADFGDGDGCRPYRFIQHPDDTTPRYVRSDLYDHMTDLAMKAQDKHVAALDRIEALTAERDALREAASDLIDIVEGVRGAMEHGTWRAERSNLRMKDTDEWVAFYNAARAALKGDGK